MIVVRVFLYLHLRSYYVILLEYALPMDVEIMKISSCLEKLVVAAFERKLDLSCHSVLPSPSDSLVSVTVIREERKCDLRIEIFLERESC